MGKDNQKCDCGQTLKFVEDVPFQGRSSGDQFIVKVASAIYECPDHGLWRIGVDGSRQRLVKR